jgi:hypothetical protein
MPGLVTAARYEIYVLLGGLMLIVVYKIFTGGINLTGLLSDKSGAFSPGRLQMLMATILTSLYYLIQVMENQSTSSLPPLPYTLVAVMGGSQAIYLGGKARNLLFPDTGKYKSK